MFKILFFNAPSRNITYLKTNVRIAAPSYPNLTLATLAGHLIKDHSVRIIDLDFVNDPWQSLSEEIDSFQPDIVAASIKTPVYNITRDLMANVKKKYPAVKTIAGGVHITAMPEEAAAAGCFDIIILGEGDLVLPDLLKSPLSSAPRVIPARPLIVDLDSLPFPAWQLFDLTKYKNSRISSRANPVGHIETSRGCAYSCNFCSKLTFGTDYRMKSTNRVVDEMEYMLKCGFKEIHIADDSFTQDIKRAKAICNEIVRRGLKFPWSLINGVRVNLVDEEFFRIAKKAGLWQTGFGIETGDQKVLEKISKKTTLEQIKRAVTAANNAGIDTFGFFIFGLSGETEESMEKTIQFSKSLPLSIAKFDICIPYPGTDYYQELLAKGKILHQDWPSYIVHQIEKPIFQHENLDWPTISLYYKRAFREYYLRPSYFWHRFLRSLKNGDLLYDVLYFLKSKW
ncbi:MAG: radical SAM protein [bacterium]|nr:radical SAM protein [bacterium]